MSGEVQPRKRRDRKKRRGHDHDASSHIKFGDAYPIHRVPDDSGDEIGSSSDHFEESHESHGSGHDEHDDHHHGPPGGFCSKLLFVVLFSALLVGTGFVVLQLKPTSKEVNTPISESRYADILGNFVDENALHDDHGHDDQHGHDGHDDHEDDHDQESQDDGHETQQAADSKTDNESLGQPVEGFLNWWPTFAPSAVEEHIEPFVEEHTESHVEEPGQSEPDVVNESGGLWQTLFGDSPPAEPEQIPQADEVSPEPLVNEPEVVNEPDSSSEETQIQEPVYQTDPWQVQGEEVKTADEWEWDNQYRYQESEPVQSNPDPRDRNDGNIYNEDPPWGPTHQEEHSEDKRERHRERREQAAARLQQSKHGEHQPREAHGEHENEVHWGYAKEDVTSKDDFEIRQELDAADDIVFQSPHQARKMFELILSKHPRSPRAMFGKGRALDALSAAKISNALLEEAIHQYLSVLDLKDTPDALFKMVAERCAERLRFRGFAEKSLTVQRRLLDRFPDDIDSLKQYAVGLLMTGQNQKAKAILKQVLQLRQSDGFAKVHLGFILKTDENNLNDSVKLMSEGIASGEPGTSDGRFYYHLGDALCRLKRIDDANTVYKDGVKKGLFLSFYQRSLYNVNGLTGRPWWTIEQTTYTRELKSLEKNWQIIKGEALALLDSQMTGFVPETENLKEKGVWKQFELFARGQVNRINCQRAQLTCKLIEMMPDAAGCTRGQVKFSLLHPGTHIWAHTGPTNCRIRAHLGLVAPPAARIRVANETKQWEQGKFIIFDDSFEHEVWHEGNTLRLVLIVDFWHPELSEELKRTLPPI